LVHVVQGQNLPISGGGKLKAVTISMSESSGNLDKIDADSPIVGVQFLGIAERAAYVRDGESNSYKWNVLGLRNVIFTFILPLSLAGVIFGFAIPARTLYARKPLRFRIAHESGGDCGAIELQPSSPPAASSDPSVDCEGLYLQGLPHLPGSESSQSGHSMVLFTELPATLPMVAAWPGNYEVRQVETQGEICIGRFHISVVDAIPLSADRIAAIRSDPNASKAVRIELGCAHCDSKFRTYAALDKSAEIEEAGFAWFADLKDSFVCACSKTTIPLTSIRKNLQGLLGVQVPGQTEVKFTRLYEDGALSSLRSTFAKLLDQSPLEERAQQFLRDNPILFHQFAPARLFVKPPILTQYFADFAVLTSKKELILVEIEQPGLRLMKQDGGIAAPLTHAFDQVHSWLQHADDHRIAMLDALKIPSADVSAIRGAVIAGRDSGYDALHLRKLKGTDRGRIAFYTFDDILFGLIALCKDIENL
jgi:hypothetical protein